MKTTALQTAIRNLDPSLLPAMSSEAQAQLAKEAKEELRILTDEAAWGNAAEEQIAKLKEQLAIASGKEALLSFANKILNIAIKVPTTVMYGSTLHQQADEALNKIIRLCRGLIDRKETP